MSRRVIAHQCSLVCSYRWSGRRCGQRSMSDHWNDLNRGYQDRGRADSDLLSRAPGFQRTHPHTCARHLPSIWKPGPKWSQSWQWSLLFTGVSCCVVPAVSTLPGVGVTYFCMAVTLTGPAVGETPLAWLAVWALTASGSLPAMALACNWVTLVAKWTLRVAVAGWIGGGRK